MTEALWTPSGFERPQTRTASRGGAAGDALAALSRGRSGAVDDPTVEQMKHNRAVNGRRTAMGARGGVELTMASGRSRDPMFYWKQNNLPYEVAKPEELRKARAYCNTPDAPVWMADFSFKAIGEIVPGEEVIGWVYRTEPSGRQRKVLVRTPVLGVQRRLAPEVVKVTFESGEVIRCTPDHLWANPHFSPGYGGQRGFQQPEYRPAQVGQSLIRIITPTPDLTDEKARLVAAWLGGLYDGEGCGEGIAQSQAHNPSVCERLAFSLDFLGLPWTRNERSFFIRTAGHGGRGTRQSMVDFLNWTQPVRRRTAALDKIMLGMPKGGREIIVSIESEGPGEVVSMQTGTGNYTAWGLASKNCRILYQTHPIIASAIDVYSKYPLTGMELVCKDEALTDFYTTLFFDQLNYEEYLVEVGREYWTVGEAWPLGSFNEVLGVWEDDELLNPDDIDVIRSPFLKEPRFQMALPESIRRIMIERSPKWEFEQLMRAYPELKNFAGQDARMPVSNVLLKQLMFKADTFHPRGIPILMRGFRAVMQEEMLNAAQDAIADRLYTPLILAKLGASATDLGTTAPWIPTPGDIEAFEEALDLALAGDFRVLTHHFAVQMESVFGRETMPNLDNDFDRITDRILQVFGLSRSMLSGAGAGETYASDAINRDLISQLLTGYQKKIQNLFRERALVVAEAQEHFDYEVRGGKRYPIMEEVLEVDEETGEQRIVEQPKLLVPELHIKAMTMRDEADQRQFYEALRATGVPISMKSRLVNVPLNLADEIDTSRQEAIDLAVEAQETRKATYLALKGKGLPTPDELKKDFEPKAMGAVEEGEAAPEVPGEQVLPSVGDLPPLTDALAPTPEELAAAEVAHGNVVPLTRNKMLQNQQPAEGAQRPPESDEMRASMPKPASKTAEFLVRTAAVLDEQGEVKEAAREEWKEIDLERDGTTGVGLLANGPRHVGLRRHSALTKDTPLGDA